MATKQVFEAEDLIYSYSRQQAIEDGELVDVSETAREAGIKFPTALTRSVWTDIVEPGKIALAHGESIQGRLWDVLWMFRCAARANGATDTILYRLIATRGGRRHTRELKAVCGPGDTLDPCITIMMPDED